jgi:hypothetical protein
MLAFVLPDFVNSYYVGMLQARRCFRLRAKPLQELIAGKLAEEKHLHRNYSVEAYLTRAVHHAHPSSRNFFQELVIAKAAQAGIGAK